MEAIDNIEQIKERLIKAITNLDKAINQKMEELEHIKKAHASIDVKKIEQALSEKTKEAEEARKKADFNEKENVRLKAELQEEKVKNQKLVKFGSDISDRVENMVKQLELVMAE